MKSSVNRTGRRSRNMQSFKTSVVVVFFMKYFNRTLDERVPGPTADPMSYHWCTET